MYTTCQGWRVTVDDLAKTAVLHGIIHHDQAVAILNILVPLAEKAGCCAGCCCDSLIDMTLAGASPAHSMTEIARVYDRLAAEC